MSQMAIDTSAIIEVLTNGPLAGSIRQAMDSADLVLVTPVARVEAAFVMIGRFGLDRAAFDRAWQALGLEETTVDSTIATLAIDAFEAWGKGRAKAGLNFGDCFSHALAAARDLPLLFVGDDFSRADLEKAH